MKVSLDTLSYWGPPEAALAHGALRAFENHCPHARGPLNMFPDKFFNCLGTSFIHMNSCHFEVKTQERNLFRSPSNLSTRLKCFHPDTLLVPDHCPWALADFVPVRVTFVESSPQL